MNSDITTALIGVGATIAGTVLGWVLNNLSNRGKLNIYVSSWEDKFQYNDDIGEMVSCSKREEVQSYTYKVSFDLYNSRGMSKLHLATEKEILRSRHHKMMQQKDFQVQWYFTMM